jgi:hydroxymethylglutaryl-CoA reductase
MLKAVSGFSRLTKSEKIEWLLDHYFTNKETARQLVTSYWNSDKKLQKLHDEFIENTISNFYLPFGVAPNFLINKEVCVELLV